MTVQHDSDCAIHNMPAKPARPCDCGAVPSWKLELAGILDSLGTRDRKRPLTFENIDELIFQLRKPHPSPPATKETEG
jgi:hypothetical protein